MLGRVKQMAKAAALNLATAPGLYDLLRRRALRDQPMTILCFHTLGADDETMDAYTVLPEGQFTALIDLLRRDYEIVSLDKALAQPAPARPQLVLTFDDGDVALHGRLLPIVQAQSLPVLAYIATGQIVDQAPYWFDRVANALQGDGERRIDLSAAGLGHWAIGPDHGVQRCATIGRLLNALKTIPPETRPSVVEDLLHQAQPISPPPHPVGPMSLDQLRDFAACPHVTIGAHSHCHNLLDQIPLSEAADSIAQSRALLQDWTGQEVAHFAYPNSNHNAALRDEVRRQGFATATVLDDALTPRDQDRFALSRINVGRYGHVQRLRLRLAGI